MDKKTETGNMSPKASEYVEALRVFAMVSIDSMLCCAAYVLRVRRNIPFCDKQSKKKQTTRKSKNS